MKGKDACLKTSQKEKGFNGRKRSRTDPKKQRRFHEETGVVWFYRVPCSSTWAAPAAMASLFLGIRWA
jgi:hypothetical protein